MNNIFCTNCGQKLSDKANFCSECGTPAKNNQVPHTLKDHPKKTIGDLEQKAWYRFLKVIYLLLFIFAMLATVSISWSIKPKPQRSIACNNGKNYVLTDYVLTENGIQLIGTGNIFASSSLNYPNCIDIASQRERILCEIEDERARILCKYGTLDFHNDRYFNEFIAKNYTFKQVYITSDYCSWIAYSLLALAIVWLVLRIIKLAFFYIAIGHKPKVEDFKKII